MNDLEVIGGGVIFGGVIFFLLGIFSMSTEFLITANILILLGLNLYMHVKQFFTFLIQKDKLKGTIAFFAGIALVFLKHPVFGIIAELVGTYWLFGGFLPALLALLSRVPVLSMILPKSFGKNETLP
ncbi:Got1-like family protein [Trichomonas vaginalis G3]|uniref:Got1-like family protein n=1 Tax=Trichomonas vaginalis (strain ATCC PRA-98 / G3) TaxID=412133 RepID=A2FMN8_TRIV3|nr:vesicle-mediated transport [Trichomonas vaginalis G3]EAX93838.1 Got1-like family protein [Trichomonas vaginalis G3]KAI5490918.1 vesicle-mediated transport [Trichomonas vaginalis G3]|eukprot:XP_001306768.1 Got1-like family protein [Trichomonas vaginalis G3]